MKICFYISGENSILGEKHKSTEDPQKQKINERILSAQCDEATPSRFPQALQEQQKK